jgi:hypothetical protein
MTATHQIETSKTRKRNRTQRKVEKPQQAIDPQTGTLDYDAAVAEAKQIIATEQSGHWRLGELAAQVETQYGKKTLKKFAEDIGVAKCTLERLRSVWRAWEPIPAAPPKFYSIAQALQDHPNRGKIIEERPNITTREARDLMREHRQGDQKQKEANTDWPLNEYRKWFVDAVKHAHDVYRDGQIVEDQLDPERRQTLCEAIEPKLLPDLRSHFYITRRWHSPRT